MAGSLNKVVLIGNLGKDPEIRAMQSGDRVCNLTIATSESWKDKASGERKEKTEWHRVVIFNQNLIGIAERYLKKGAKVYLEGQIETRKWQDKDGSEKYSTEVVLRPYRGEIVMLDRAGNDNGGGGNYGGGRDNSFNQSSDSSPPSFSPPGMPMDDFDDEIPF